MKYFRDVAGFAALIVALLTGGALAGQCDRDQKIAVGKRGWGTADTSIPWGGSTKEASGFEHSGKSVQVAANEELPSPPAIPRSGPLTAEAQYELAVSYAEGRGVPKDTGKAAQWYRRAAEQGHVRAQFNLGQMYLEGNALPQDDKEALKWFHQAAELGYAQAQFALGMMLYGGRGVPTGFEMYQVYHREAEKWLLRAAEQDYAPAQCALGNMYSFQIYITGSIVPNPEEAAKWYRRAADQQYVCHDPTVPR